MNKQLSEVRDKLKSEQNVFQTESLAVVKVQKQSESLRTEIKEVQDAEKRGNAEDQEKIEAIIAQMRRDIRECDEINLLEKAIQEAEQQTQSEEQNQKKINQ